MRQPKYPAGWDEKRVRRVLKHYEAQSDEEAVAEDEAAYEATTLQRWRSQSNWSPPCVS